MTALHFLSKLHNLGIRASDPFNFKNKVRVFNNAIIVIFFISLFYCITSFVIHFYWATVVTFYSILSTIFSLYLVSIRKSCIAFHYMMWYGFIFLSCFSFLFGTSNNSYYYFLFMPIACNIFFDTKKESVFYLIISILFMAANIVYTDYFEPYYKKESWMPLVSYPNIIFAPLLIFLGVSLFKKENISYAYQIEEQRKTLEEKNNEITDSINYAKRLQNAILPPLSFIRKYLPEVFIIYKPKDIVAGDFYWMEHMADTTFIAAADSTGHGVPGAMVSVVCCNALNRALNEYEITDPGKILDKTRELVMTTFAKSDDEVKDGMDISLLAIKALNNGSFDIKWSGANNSLWYIENGELVQIKAHKQPIGNTLNPTPFPTHELILQKNTIIFLITDGFADQFGGVEGKKFKQKQLQQILISNFEQPLEQQKQQLENAFELWKGNLDQVDDITVIGIKLK